MGQIEDLQPTALDFSQDDLSRQKFADLLISYSVNLASATAAPAGRVIAVDAPWGSGKSWIAKRLPTHLPTDTRIGACVYVDAFQFDYHQDPFAVLTSAILESYKNDSKAVSDLKSAAVNVLKATLPAIGKGLIKTGGKAIGLDTDDLMEAAMDTVGDSSEKVIKKMLETFEKTNASTKAFKKKLSELATKNANNAPLIIVVDELDRCRPSYALELLERIKHLFEVPNVVFILFLHTPALHSAIRKTYGYDINPSEYLRKFITLTVGLPVSETSSSTSSDRSDFFEKFLNSQFPPPIGRQSQLENDFRKALCDLATVFNASFRDIENVMLLKQLLGQRSFYSGDFLAYGLLLRVKNPEQILLLKNSDYETITNQFKRFDKEDENETLCCSTFRQMFTYAVDPVKYETTYAQSADFGYQKLDAAQCKNRYERFMRALDNLSLEHIRI
jgi:KAP family P-loop domain